MAGLLGPGVGAGALLVFILAIGYYITPALLGGPNDQMVSYYVAYFTNVTINWGMACALGGLLLAAIRLRDLDRLRRVGDRSRSAEARRSATG